VLREMKRPLVILTAFLALAACGGESGNAHKVAQNSSNPTPAAASSPSSGRHIPFTLTIKAIGLTAIVEQVGRDKYGNMAIPANPKDVGWYAPGVAPGENGDAVIDGHLDWYNMPQGPFYHLSELKTGDQIEVQALDGTVFVFTVVAPGSTVPYNSKPAGLFSTTGKPRLTLITCAGDWNAQKQTYTKREIVNAVLTATHGASS